MVLKESDCSDFTRVVRPQNHRARSIVEVSNGIVQNVASTAVESVCTGTIGANSIVAEIIPDILATDIRAGSIVPAQSIQVKFSAYSFVAHLSSSILHVLIDIPFSSEVEKMLVVQEAAIIAWVVNSRFEAADVGIK